MRTYRVRSTNLEGMQDCSAIEQWLAIRLLVIVPHLCNRPLHDVCWPYVCSDVCSSALLHAASRERGTFRASRRSTAGAEAAQSELLVADGKRLESFD